MVDVLVAGVDRNNPELLDGPEFLDEVVAFLREREDPGQRAPVGCG